MAPKSTPQSAASARRFRRRLLAWFARHGRDLAWRRSRDPYRILLSEVMLQQTQVARVAEYYPRFLAAFPTLRLLPGVGRYTAGAVASFAFEQPVPAVDTNVARVLRRAFHPRLAKGARGEQRIWETAAAILPRRGAAAWAFNQAIMELGALVCTARVARCEVCPVVGECITGRKREQSTVNSEQ